MDIIVLWIFNDLSYCMNVILYIGVLYSYYKLFKKYVYNVFGQKQYMYIYYCVLFKIYNQIAKDICMNMV